MEQSGDGARTLASGAPRAEEAAAWRFLDAVWDVPIGLGLCDAQLRFVRVNHALADFDGLSIAAHYEDDTLQRLPLALADGLHRDAFQTRRSTARISRSVVTRTPSSTRPLSIAEIAGWLMPDAAASSS
jgi:PAS domain-containing protein